MKPQQLILALASSAILLVTGLPAQALVLPAAAFEELVQQADGIVYGRVVEKRVAWNAEHTLLFTHYAAEVERTFKGFHGTRVEWSEIGGQLDGLSMYVEGTPQYEVGEESVVFLHSEKGRAMTLRWYQGKLPVRSDRGQPMVALPGGESLTIDQLGRRIVEVAPAGGQP